MSVSIRHVSPHTDTSSFVTLCCVTFKKCWKSPFDRGGLQFSFHYNIHKSILILRLQCCWEICIRNCLKRAKKGVEMMGEHKENYIAEIDFRIFLHFMHSGLEIERRLTFQLHFNWVFFRLQGSAWSFIWTNWRQFLGVFKTCWVLNKVKKGNEPKMRFKVTSMLNLIKVRKNSFSMMYFFQAVCKNRELLISGRCSSSTQ